MDLIRVDVFLLMDIALRQRVKATGEEGRLESITYPSDFDQHKEVEVSLLLDNGKKRSYALSELEPCEFGDYG